MTCILGGVPELAHAVETPVGYPQIPQCVGVVGVGQCGRRDRAGPRFGGVIGGRSDAEAMLGKHSTDRVDSEFLAVGIDVLDDQRSRRSTCAAAKNALAVRTISLAAHNSGFSRSSSVIR